MIEIAFLCPPLEVLADPKAIERAQGVVDRGWQDKSRKVRPVGWSGNVSYFNPAPNLARFRHNCPIEPGCCSSSVFDTLRRAR